VRTRHHRYIFEEKKGKAAAKEAVGARLQEIGPRFTLRLRSLQVTACPADVAQLHGAPAKQFAKAAWCWASLQSVCYARRLACLTGPGMWSGGRRQA